MKITSRNVDLVRAAIEAASPENKAKKKERLTEAAKAFPARYISAAASGDTAVKHELSKLTKSGVFDEARQNTGTPDAQANGDAYRAELERKIRATSQNRVLDTEAGRSENRKLMRFLVRQHHKSNKLPPAGRLKFDVLATSTNYEKILRLDGSKAGLDKTGTGINRPTNDQTALGVCMGRCGQFLETLRSGIESGKDPEEAAILATRDRDSLLKGAIKQRAYHSEHHRTVPALIAELQNKSADILQKLDEATGASGNRDEAAALRVKFRAELEDVEAKGNEKIMTAAIGAYAKAGISIKELISPDNAARESPIKLAMQYDGPSLIQGISNPHVVAHFKDADTHFILDPNLGLFKTKDPETASTLIATMVEAKSKNSDVNAILT